MKEVRIIVEINADGEIAADADGFTDGACLADLGKLFADLASAPAETTRKQDQTDPRRRSRRVQTTKRRG